MKLDTFTRAYIECALWSSSADIGDCDSCGLENTLQAGQEDCPNCGARLHGLDNSMEDHNLGIEDIAPGTLASMIADCQTFREDNSELLAEWYDTADETEDRAGHDFWLTRNRHGAGFWDRWSGGSPQAELGRRLTDSAHAYGSSDLYLVAGTDPDTFVIHAS